MNDDAGAQRWTRAQAVTAIVTVALLLGLTAWLSGAAPATSPAAVLKQPAPLSPSAVEGEAIRRTRIDPAAPSAPAGAKSTVNGASGSATPNTFDMKRVGLALLAVVALIVTLRWIAKRYFSVPGAGRASRAVQVLSRSILSPKQQLMVVQVGRRLIVVGDTGTQMNPLCEIRDPDEVAELVGQITQEKGDSITKTFGQLFGRAKSQFDEEDDGGSKALVAPTRRPPSDADDEAADDPGLAETRTELSGLADRIRLLSRQFRGG